MKASENEAMVFDGIKTEWIVLNNSSFDLPRPNATVAIVPERGSVQK
jgi:hypothetical protein